MSNYKSTLQSNNTELSSNNLDLQSLIDQANALPDAGGVELPELINEGTAADLLSGKELIDGDGNKVTGTFSIDSELNTQDDLIAQIQAAVDGLPEAGGGSGSTPIETCTVTVNINGLSGRHYFTTIFTEENGMSPGTNEIIGLTKPTIIENVVCGSGVFLITSRPILAGHSVAGGASLIKYDDTNSSAKWLFSIPQKPTGEVVITVREDD